MIVKISMIDFFFFGLIESDVNSACYKRLKDRHHMCRTKTLFESVLIKITTLTSFEWVYETKDGMVGFYHFGNDMCLKRFQSVYTRPIFIKQSHSDKNESLLQTNTRSGNRSKSFITKLLRWHDKAVYFVPSRFNTLYYSRVWLFRSHWDKKKDFE